MQAALIKAISDASEAGQPFQATGKFGLWINRERLPEQLRVKTRVENLTSDLLAAGLIVKCAFGTEKGGSWLDVPTGPFARCVGEFSPGYVAVKVVP
jgi:hypothetical protein